MKNLIIGVALAVVFIPGFVWSAETVEEKVQDATNDVSREVKKKVHRLEEATCTESDMECLKEKSENRLEEGSEALEDKATELKNDVD